MIDCTVGLDRTGRFGLRFLDLRSWFICGINGAALFQVVQGLS